MEEAKSNASNKSVERLHKIKPKIPTINNTHHVNTADLTQNLRDEEYPRKEDSYVKLVNPINSKNKNKNKKAKI